MKLVLVLAFAMLALALPATAATPDTTVPADASIQAPTAEVASGLEIIFKMLPASCDDLIYTSCTQVNATQKCKDACGYLYTCTCRWYGPNKYWDCPLPC